MVDYPKFPTTKGLAWGSTIEPMFKTKKQMSENGQRKTVRKYIYPEYRLTCEFKVLTQKADKVFGDIQSIMGFFLEMAGSDGVFLWKDSEFSHVDDILLGVADGTTKTYQLKKQMGNYIEPVLDVDNLVIKGTEIHYEVNEYGQVVFDTAPPRDTRITATYDYYWRVAFKNDNLQFKNFYNNLWSLKKMELVTVK